MATVLAQPDYARARPSTLLEKDATYKKLFNSKNSLHSYYNIAYIGKYVMDVIRQEVKYTPSERTNIQFGTLYYYVACLVRNTRITPIMIEGIDIDNLNRADVVRVSDTVLAILNTLGGTDKTAKNSEFASALISSVGQELASIDG